MPIWWRLASPVPMPGWRPLRDGGGQIGSASSRRRGAGPLCRCIFSPGEAFQFDWSEDFAVLGGERTKLQMAHIKLSHSRAFLLRAYPLQTHEMLFDAHWHGFRVFGGVPGRGIYDNMKTAVDRVGRGKERQVNMRFLAMTNHYVYRARVLQSGGGLGERPGREERSGFPPPDVARRCRTSPILPR